MSQSRWSSVDDVTEALRRRWRRGDLLRWVASGRPWEPLRVPLSGPTARELSEQFDAAREWARRVQAAADGRFRIEHRRVGGRLVGANELPAAAWFDTPEQVWAVLRVNGEVAAYRELLVTSADTDPRLREWVAERPLRALEHRARWPEVLQTVGWLRDTAGTGVYLRQVEVPGVDTKFIESHEPLLLDLLEVLRPPLVPEGRGLVARHGFRRKPDRTRWRSLDGPVLPGSRLTDLTFTVEELADHPLHHPTVLVVENEVTFLALPPLPGVVACFGSGFDVLRLGRLPWLRGRRVVYWGDLDTHGFVILDRLRALLPDVESVLMDLSTLLAHRDQWVAERRPSKELLGRLTAAEQDVYADLVGDVHGASVRLEQERVSYAVAVEALRSRVA